MANHDIDNFIRGLVYDPHEILAVAPDGDVSTQPATMSKTPAEARRRREAR
jgi:hypothetical protein